MIETVYGGDREPISIWKKINPLWWLVGPQGWTAPLVNNGTVYLPGIDNQLVRNFYWFCRNPLMNFVGFVLGVEDKNYNATGTAPVMLTTWADASPPQRGWKWSVVNAPWSLAWFAAYLVLTMAIPVVSLWLAPAALLALCKGCGLLPFVSYAGPVVFYLGWRPASGGFGFKLVKGKPL